MKVSASKYCDGCREAVAQKSLFWHTIEDYVTVRGDDVPGYYNYEDRTSRVELHYCKTCWNTIAKQLPFKRDAGAVV